MGVAVKFDGIAIMGLKAKSVCVLCVVVMLALPGETASVKPMHASSVEGVQAGLSHLLADVEHSPLSLEIKERVESQVVDFRKVLEKEEKYSSTCMDCSSGRGDCQCGRFVPSAGRCM